MSAELEHLKQQCSANFDLPFLDKFVKDVHQTSIVGFDCRYQSGTGKHSDQ